MPSKRLTNDELIQTFNVEKNFLNEKIGITTRCIAGNHEATSDLAIKAAEKIFKKNAGLKKEDIDLLILITQNPDYKLPHTSAIVQDKLGLKLIASFDINLGCSGFVYALGVAKSMMNTLGFNNVLVITADIYSRITSPTDKNTVALFGDAAAVVWLGKKASNEFLNFSFGTDGSGYDRLIVKGGGSRFPIYTTKRQGKMPDRLSEQQSQTLYMDSRQVYNFMMKVVPGDIKKCLDSNNLSLSQIDYFVFHQASKFMLESLTARLGVPKEKVILFLKDIGNTVSSSIPLALEHLSHSKDLSGKKVLISGFGVGLSWGSTIINYM